MVKATALKPLTVILTLVGIMVFFCNNNYNYGVC